LKQLVKRLLEYRPRTDTGVVREALQPLRAEGGLPVCPPWEGDLVFETLKDIGATSCLEIGFHTGSTALYMLHALRENGGTVVSIEPRPDGIRGFDTVASFDAAQARHDVIEALSHDALPQILADGRTFDFIFVDGWKTFNALAVDAYYAARLLRTGGVLFFDDHHMPSVRKVVRLLKTHYGFTALPALPAQSNAGFRLYLAMISGTRHMPFTRIRKSVDIDDAPAARDWNFFAKF
jgi:predicted O-methyltransferase YrrM